MSEPPTIRIPRWLWATLTYRFRLPAWAVVLLLGVSSGIMNAILEVVR